MACGVRKNALLSLLFCAAILLFHQQVALAFFSSLFHKQPKGCGVELLRLPKRVSPVHYDLYIHPDFISWDTFNGSVKISLQVDEDESQNGHTQVANNQIVLHADIKLSIENVRCEELHRNGDKPAPVEVKSVCRDQRYQLLVITLNEKLRPESNYRLSINFKGEIGTQSRGFYKAPKNGPNTATDAQQMLATQFESTDARLAFPCFDEPNFKATFDIALRVPIYCVAVSNTEVTSETLIEGTGDKIVHFERSPPMSTYLVAFLMGKLDHLEEEIRLKNKKIKIKIWTTPGRAQEGRLALEAAIKSVELMENYYGIDYMLNKIELASLPAFNMAAMENWGLITAREDMILVDENNTALDSQALVASTMVHEMSHQWFGNLVTMNWWNDLWLNEAFATWMQHKLMYELYPGYEFEYYYLLKSHIQALDKDAKYNTRSVIWDGADLQYPGDIMSMFSPITYNKGAAIIRVLDNDYMKSDSFAAAIRCYLAEYKYKNTVSLDLLRIMDLYSGKNLPPVSDFMNSWLSQPGYPLVSVDLERSKREITFTQERFILDSSAKLSEDQSNQRWLIPISILVHSRGRQELMELVWDPRVESERDLKRVSLPEWFDVEKPGSWLKVNANYSGYYRVKYSEPLIELMEEAIRSKSMLPADRLNVLDEALTLMKAERFSKKNLAKLVSWFEGENHGAVIERIRAAFIQLDTEDMEVSIGSENDFFKTLRKNLDSTPKTAGKGLSRLECLGYTSILEYLVSIMDADIEKELLVRFEQPEPIEPCLRSAIYRVVAKLGDDSQFERLRAMAEKTKSREELKRIAIALSMADSMDRFALGMQLAEQSVS